MSNDLLTTAWLLLGSGLMAFLIGLLGLMAWFNHFDGGRKP